jgi:HEAT repeat protein
MLQSISFKLLALLLNLPVTATEVITSLDWTSLVQIVGLLLSIVSLLSSFFIFWQIRSRSMVLLAESLEPQERIEYQEHEEKVTDRWERVGQARVIERIQQVQSRQQLTDTYRRRLCKDPQMIQLRILSMTWSLNLLQVYIPLRLCQNRQLSIVAPDTAYAQMTQDPNLVLQAERMRLKQRVNAAIEPSAAVRLYQRCVILGGPGSGKTTLLKYLAVRCARRELRGLSDLPIYIHLNAFAQSLQRQNSTTTSFAPGEQSNLLLTFAATQWDIHYDISVQEALTCIRHNLEEGNALLLLDGLDETFVGSTEKAANKSYKCVINIIRDLAATYTKAFIVVTARIAEYQQHLPLTNFTELVVLGFRERDIEHFVNNWFKYDVSSQTSTEQVCSLIDHLQHPHVQVLATNPLLLALLVIISRQESTLPQQRATIYKCCIDTLLTAWEENQSHTVPHDSFAVFSKEDKERLLKEVAWQFHLKGQSSFPLAELSPIITQFLTTLPAPQWSVGQILAAISTESGLLKEQEAGCYTFLHLTLQEYFVALTIAESKEKYKILQEHLYEAHWKEILLLYAGLAGDTTPLLQHLWLKGGYNRSGGPLSDPLFHHNLILAGQCLAASTTAGLTYRSNIINRLFKVLIGIPAPYRLTQQRIAATLAEMGERNTDNRYFASGRSKSQTINRRLLDILTEDEERIEPGVKMSIAHALGTYGNVSIVTQLVELLAAEGIKREVRICIAQTLRISGKHSAAKGMANYLSHRLIDHEVRLSIATALGDLIDDTLVAQLISLINDQSLELDMRCAIIDALGASGNRASVPDLQALYAHINKSGEFLLYWHTVIALAALGEYQELPALLPLLANNDYPVETHLSIVNGLAALRLPSLIPEYLTLLQNEIVHWEVRAAIAVALEAVGDFSIISLLLTLLADEQVDALLRAVMVDISSKSGDYHLLSRLPIEQTDNLYLYRSVITARTRLGDESTATVLLNWLSHQEAEGITSAEALSMLDALAQVLDRLIKNAHISLATSIVRLAQSQNVHRDVQREFIALLPQIACELALLPAHEAYIQQEITSSLIALLGQEYDDIVETAHTALWEVSHYLSPRFISTEYWYSLQKETHF